jgi:signal transduction histidine kinase
VRLVDGTIESDNGDCPRAPDLPVSVAVTIAMAALSAATLWGLYGTRGDVSIGVDVAVAVVAVALVPLTLRRPLLGGLLLGVLAAVSPTATPPATFAALYATRQRRLTVGLAVAVTGIVAHAVRGWWRPPGGLSYGWWLVLMTAAYAALVGWGALARARHALLVSLRERARRAEAEQGRRVAEARVAERARIAREMHDVLAHRLSLVATYAGALEYRPDSSPEQLSKAAGVVRAGVHQALDELREVITIFGDEEVGQPTGSGGLAALVEESRDAGTQVRLDDRLAASPALPAATGRTAYRVVQESLTNARRHATGQPVTVVLDGRPGDGLVIEVRNPLPAKPFPSPGGTGLVGLTERVRLAGGRLDHGSTGTGDFRVHAWLPWPP